MSTIKKRALQLRNRFPLSFVTMVVFIGCDTRPSSFETPPPNSQVVRHTTERATPVKPPEHATSPPAREQRPPPTPTAATSAYARDIRRICFSEQFSGALEQPESARPILVAQWLGANIESDRGRSFLATLARSKPSSKPGVLDKESKRTGLSECPLARTWEKPPASNDTQ